MTTIMSAERVEDMGRAHEARSTTMQLLDGIAKYKEMFDVIMPLLVVLEEAMNKDKPAKDMPLEELVTRGIKFLQELK